MFGELLNSTGTGSLQIAVMIFFFLIFVGVIVWIIRMKKSFVKKMENMPLEESNSVSSNGENNNG